MNNGQTDTCGMVALIVVIGLAWLTAIWNTKTVRRRRTVLHRSARYGCLFGSKWTR
ncbi:MAG: hypothetical protein ACKOC5_07625 [Chloroflexota bacterium]